MNRRSNVGRLMRVLPATTVAVVCVLAFFVFVAWHSVTDDRPGGIGEIVWPSLILAVLLVFVGLGVDGGRNAHATAETDEVLPMSATDLERAASQCFAEARWTVQRDKANLAAKVAD